MTVGALEIFLVLFVVLLIIGPRRIANLGRALGRSIHDFKLEFGKDKKDKKALGDKHSDTRKKDPDTDDDKSR